MLEGNRIRKNSVLPWSLTQFLLWLGQSFEEGGPSFVPVNTSFRPIRPRLNHGPRLTTHDADFIHFPDPPESDNIPPGRDFPKKSLPNGL